MMLIILFLILCQNLKHKSWTLKGSKLRGVLRGQTISALGSTCVCTWMYAHKKLPTAPYSVLARSVSVPVSRSQWGLWPKSSFAPSKESWETEGTVRTLGTWVPDIVLSERGQQSWGAWAGVALPLPAGAGRLQPLHLCTPPSPL